MIKLFSFKRIALAALPLPMGVLGGLAAYGQTINIKAVVEATQTTTRPALNNTGEFTAVVYNDPAMPLPASLPPGSYPAWCGGRSGQSFDQSQAYSLAFTPAAVPGTITPALLAQQTTWNQINYVLNNKGAFQIVDVQVVIWGLLNGLCSPANTSCTSASYITQRDPSALPLYNAASGSAGQNFTAAPGQITMALLANTNTTNQNMIIELVNGGMIGDRVWFDKNGNGIQDVAVISGTPGVLLTLTQVLSSFGYYFDGAVDHAYQYSEPGVTGDAGLNGITVQLQDSNGNVVASKVTGPSPASYPFMPPGTNGWYQFTGLDYAAFSPGAFKVVVPTSQPAIVNANLLPTQIGVGGAAAAGTNSQNPAAASVTLPTAVNETLDFGFTGPQPLQATCVTGTAVINGPYSSTIVVSGGVTPYTFALASGSLPPGLTLNPNTGVISGSPTATGTYSFAVQVTDSSSGTAQTTTLTCGITVNPPPITLSCPASSAQLGLYYSSQLMASGGVPAYTYSVVQGSLPGGLTLDSATGTISGTPASAGFTSYTAAVTDTSGTSAGYRTTNCGVNVLPMITVNCASITAVQGLPITPTPVTASGGAGAPYKFSAIGLPDGLTMAGNGTISGTPSASGTFAYTVTVTDSAGNSRSFNCSVTVNPPVSSTCLSFTAVQGAPVSTGAMTGSGGTGGPYTFTASGLPVGLSMNPDGSITGTPALSGTFSYTVTIKDKDGHTGTLNCSVIVTVPVVTIGRGDTATIGFWHNKNGQALISSLNGGPGSTALGNWLATNFPYLYGPQAGSANDMTNKTNAQVAAYDLFLFANDKTAAQILGGAIASYVTNTVLAGGTYASGYGFNTSASGTGSHIWNVGGNGAGVGLSNNQSYTVMQLLQQVNQSKKDGTYNSRANAFNSIFDGINQGGDIT
jgi:hypothetical protein